MKWSPEDAAGVVCVLEGKMTPNGPVLTKVVLTGADLKPAHLRLPFLGVLRGAFATAALGPREGGGYSRKSGVAHRVPVGVGRPIDIKSARQRLDEVAEVYTEAPVGGKGRAVADHFGVAVSYARTLVAEARRAGLIE